MSALATPPVPGLVSEIPVQPAAAAADAALGLLAESRDWTPGRIKDLLVTFYAFGLLGFGIFFPFVLVAWKLLFGPAAG